MRYLPRRFEWSSLQSNQHLSGTRLDGAYSTTNVFYAYGIATTSTWITLATIPKRVELRPATPKAQPPSRSPPCQTGVDMVTVQPLKKSEALPQLDILYNFLSMTDYDWRRIRLNDSQSLHVLLKNQWIDLKKTWSVGNKNGTIKPATNW